MAYNQSSNNHFFLGALMGGIIGGATGLLFAPKKGEDLRHDIHSRYNQLNDITRTLTGKAKRFAHMNHDGYHEENSSRNFLLGSIAGSLIGATTAFLLAPKAGSQLRKDLTNRYSELAEQTQHFANEIGKKTKILARNADSHAGEWKELAGEILDKITSNLSHSRGSRLPKVDDMMDWVNIGVRLWNNFSKRR